MLCSDLFSFLRLFEVNGILFLGIFEKHTELCVNFSVYEGDGNRETLSLVLSHLDYCSVLTGLCHF